MCALQNAQQTERLFKMKIAEDTYNDETRVKASVISVEPLCFSDEASVGALPGTPCVHLHNEFPAAASI